MRDWRRLKQTVFMLLWLAVPLAAAAQSLPDKGVGCLSCHEGIARICEADSGMSKQIAALGKSSEDPRGCVVCHGGNPSGVTEEEAHGGEAFHPDPGSPWINEQTCGMCHAEHVHAQWNSLMMTEAGKIQGASWAFGALEGYEHKWGNYNAQNPGDAASRLGTPAYRQYMERLQTVEPQVFPRKMTAVPQAPQNPDLVAAKPELAAFTYLRTDCLRCHLGVRGRQKRGDYRGMGCSACHMPYGNEGLYEGEDQSVNKDEPGHVLVHAMQSSRKTKVTVHGTPYSGIPVETCSSCHDRGKRIGVSFQGLMESAYESPVAQEGSGQPALHTKHYMAMSEDIHYQAGMVCQDCHTSGDVHGDGFLAGTTLAQVEIECADCHGTTRSYPWELPLGYGDEFGAALEQANPRGVTKEQLSYVRQGSLYEPADGYLLTARGNPFGNVVRKDNQVVIHTAGGKDLTIEPLKSSKEQELLNLEARVAMDSVKGHTDKMECYTCHAAWAPQCYGCHVKIDYSQEKMHFDWIAAGKRHEDDAHASDRGEAGYDALIPGAVTEQRSYLRWADPALGVNGEGRIAPVIPGCQTTVTVLGSDGQPILLNHIFRTPADTEGGGPEGQLAIDMSPTNPHTSGKSRSCESCHINPKTAGYGIDRGQLNRSPDQPVIVDLMTAEGQVLPRSARTQIEAVPGLTADWSRFVTESGAQLQTVGHHFKNSRPLNNDERQHMSRTGTCLACHKEIPDEDLTVSMLHHIAQSLEMLPQTEEQHGTLLHKIMLIAAWSQSGVILILPLLVVAAILGFYLKRRKRKKMNGADFFSSSPKKTSRITDE